MEAAGGDLIVTSPDILGKLSGKDNPQALVGVYRDRLTPLQDVDRASADIWIVAQSLRDPGNLGHILRSGDAGGAGGLFLITSAERRGGKERVRQCRKSGERYHEKNRSRQYKRTRRKK